MGFFGALGSLINLVLTLAVEFANFLARTRRLEFSSLIWAGVRPATNFSYRCLRATLSAWARDFQVYYQHPSRD